MYQWSPQCKRNPQNAAMETTIVKCNCQSVSRVTNYELSKFYTQPFQQIEIKTVDLLGVPVTITGTDNN